MSCNVTLDRRPKKFLEKLAKSAPREYLKIYAFLNDELPNSENPCRLPSARYLEGFNDNRWRWRIGEYRVIGKVQKQEIFFIQVVRIARKSNRTYKGL